MQLFLKQWPAVVLVIFLQAVDIHATHFMVDTFLILGEGLNGRFSDND